MTKIEELALWVIDNRYPKSEKDKVSDCEMFQYIVESCTAIREQVVIDALPTHEECKAMCPYPDKLYWTFGMDQMRDIATQRLTTRAEVERPFVDLLKEIRKALPMGYSLPLSIQEQFNSLTDNK